MADTPITELPLENTNGFAAMNTQASASAGRQAILDQTLGEVLKSNNQAQGMIMKSMQVSPQQLQQMLQMTGNNELMNMKIGELFKNGTVQKAMMQQSTDGNTVVTPPRQASFLDKIKSWFK